MRVVTPGAVLGCGLGGFVDGIVLHQILQWHNMGSAVLPPVTMSAMSRNMVWDGLFHAATWLVTFVGVWMLWAEGVRSAPRAQVLAGQMIFGWGAFNLIEGLGNHHLLHLHHVRDLPHHVPHYDWTFLAVAGVGLLILGWSMAARRQPA
ncbi:DUF2243 domain-containing protein [Luteitalea sp.]|uniref:DUF2243 domain-containing protein n=1 Tax=Luteitalea sp. TaxID=2004800 RepID=UPI0025BF7F37|nr:DUF2243 domain-containing protein [Luteitalea sp.]